MKRRIKHLQSHTLYELVSSLIQTQKLLYSMKHSDLLENPQLREKIVTGIISQLELNDEAGKLYASDYGIPYREEIAKETPTGNKLTLLHGDR
jgi:hypothetical protein